MSDQDDPEKSSQAEIDEAWSIFAEEAGEHLDAVENILMELEKAPADKERIKQLFRSLHTLKGMAGLQGLSDLHRLSHKAEDLVGLVRDRGAVLDAPMIDLLLEVQDVLKTAMARAIKTRENSPVSEDVLKRLEEMFLEKQSPTPAAVPSEPPAAANDDAPADAVPAVSAQDPDVLAYFLDMAVEESRKMEAGIAALRSGDQNGGAMAALAAETLSFAAGQMGYESLAATLEALGKAAGRSFAEPLDELARDARKQLADIGVALRNPEEPDATAETHPADNPALARDAGDGLAANPVGMETSETAPRNAEELEEIADLIGELVASSSEMEHVISRLSRQEIRENLIRQARQSQAAYAGKSVEVWDRVLAILDLHLLAAHEDLQKLKRGIVRVKSILDQFQEIPAISLYRKIMDGIVVGVGNIRYVVPTEVVCRILHPEPGQIVFSTADGGKALNLRGELIPLYSLGDERNNNSSVLSDKMIIVVETARQLAALSVNKVIGRQQILICPLQGFMKEIKGAIGCCILGGGEIGVALDMNKMLAAA